MIHLDFSAEAIEAALVVQVQIKGQRGAHNPCERRGSEERVQRCGGGAPARIGQATGRGAGDDGVPVVLPPAAREAHAALDGPDYGQQGAAPAGERRDLRADGTDAAGEASAAGRVAEAAGEVVGGAEHRAEREAATNVIDEAVAISPYDGVAMTAGYRTAGCGGLMGMAVAAAAL
nr:unnamed protein product [Digitaria exilis]